jgi:hypothetical protein
MTFLSHSLFNVVFSTFVVYKTCCRTRFFTWYEEKRIVEFNNVVKFPFLKKKIKKIKKYRRGIKKSIYILQHIYQKLTIGCEANSTT